LGDSQLNVHLPKKRQLKESSKGLCPLHINNYIGIILLALSSYKVKKIATDECVIKKTGELMVLSSQRNVFHFGQVPNFHEQYRF
jgi:hypothetical protein